MQVLRVTCSFKVCTQRPPCRVSKGTPRSNICDPGVLATRCPLQKTRSWVWVLIFVQDDEPTFRNGTATCDPQFFLCTLCHRSGKDFNVFWVQSHKYKYDEHVFKNCHRLPLKVVSQHPNMGIASFNTRKVPFCQHPFQPLKNWHNALDFAAWKLSAFRLHCGPSIGLRAGMSRSGFETYGWADQERGTPFISNHSYECWGNESATILTWRVLQPTYLHQFAHQIYHNRQLGASRNNPKFNRNVPGWVEVSTGCRFRTLAQEVAVIGNACLLYQFQKIISWFLCLFSNLIHFIHRNWSIGQSSSPPNLYVVSGVSILSI